MNGDSFRLRERVNGVRARGRLWRGAAGARARAGLAEHAAAIALQVASLPGEALRACKSCIAAAGNPARDDYAEELAQSRRLYASAATRQRVAAFLAGELR